MAREALSVLYCWTLRFDGLTVHLASSDKGALRVSLSLDHTQGCQDFFARRWPSKKILKDRTFNLPLIEHTKAAFEGRPIATALPMDIRLTPFQSKALATISKIPEPNKPYL